MSKDVLPASELSEILAGLQLDDRAHEQDMYYASIDRTHDGMWSAEGFNGMMMALDEPDFLKAQYEEFLEDQEMDSSLVYQDEFLDLDAVEETEHEELRDFLISRNLSLASGVITRMAEGTCPPRVRIRRMDSSEREEILELKRKGNQAFQETKYREAVELYEDALLCFDPNMFVGPISDMNELVTILSNTAECHLRLEQYNDAGSMATDALMLDASHEKTRIRRAKAELALHKEGSFIGLIQANVDLQEVLDDPNPRAAAIDTANKLLKKVNSKLDREEKRMLSKNPNADWAFIVRQMKVTCW